MRRIVNSIVSVVLVLGLMPSFAWAAELRGAQDARAAIAASPEPGSFAAAQSRLGAASVQGGTVTLADARLYAAVRAQLDEQGIEYATDGSSAITLDAANMARLTSLDVSHQRVSDLSGIQAFTQLTSLKAFDNELTVEGVQAVGGLSNLVYLDVSRNHIMDPADSSEATLAKAVAPLAKLEYLDVSHCGVRYTAGMDALAELKHLDLFDNLVRDFSGIRGLAQLAYLDLGENNAGSSTLDDAGLSVLDDLGNLAYFCFSSNKTPSITGHVGNMKALKTLRLEGNGITDIAPLAGMRQMETLVLSNNSISGVQALLDMPQLAELYLNGNKLYTAQAGVDSSGLEGIFSGDRLVWQNLKKIDISDNWDWDFRGSGMGPRLFALDQAGQIELGYDYQRLYRTENLAGTEYDSLVVRNTPFSQLPHTDASGVKYVTYDDFGAKADGSYDDYIAMHNAHAYANTVGCEVRADGSKTYHIFKTYSTQWYNCATNVDWQGATFVIHDENVDSMTGRNVPLLCMWPTAPDNTASGSWRSSHSDIVTMTSDNADASLRPDVSIGRDTTQLSGPNFNAQLDRLAALGYRQFYVQAFDANTKHYIRFGHNYAGSDQTDGFIVDAQGTLTEKPDDPAANKPQWSFDTVTKLVITPLPDTQAHVKNATIIWNPPASKSEVPYPHSKGMTYYYRNFQVRDCGNVKVSDIRYCVGTPETNFDNDEKSGSYFGNLQVFNAAQIVLENDAFFARKYGDGGRSTYGLVISDVVDILIKDCTSNPQGTANADRWLLDDKRWGVTGNNRDKDITFQNCTFNRIDAHEGYCNMKAIDCTVGIHAFTLTGQGPLSIERCKILSNYLVKLRGDYGSTWDTWDGAARIVDCTLEYHGQYSQGLVSASPAYDDAAHTQVHEFGYPLRYPNVYVENLTVDERAFDPAVSQGKDDFFVVPNSTYNDTHLLPASYWPDWVTVNGIRFTNWSNVRHGTETQGHAPYFRLTETTDGGVGETAAGRPERSYWVGNVTVLQGGADGDDVTERALMGEELSSAGPYLVKLGATDADSMAASYDVYRNGASIEKGVPVEGAIERRFTVPGDYEVRVHSTDARGGWKATRTLAFTIEGLGEPEPDEALLYTRTVTLDGSSAPVPGSVKSSNYVGLAPADVADRDVTVRFTGEAPTLRVRQDGTTAQGASGWLYFSDLQPSRVDDLADGWKLARFAGEDIARAWESAAAYNGAYDTGDYRTGSIAVQRGDYNRAVLAAPASGACTFDRIALTGGQAAVHPGKDWVVAGKTADQIVQDMKAGWNLGNTLDAYLGTDDGPSRELDRGDLETEVLWGNPKTTFDTIRFVKDAGFNAVRVPVTWYQHVYDDGVDVGDPNRSAEHKYHIDEAWLARVREVVDYCYDQGMYVTLNTHHEKFWLETPQFGDADARAAMKEELAAIWTQLATEFSDYDQRLVFEGLNEPRATGEGISRDREWESSTPQDIETLNQLNQTFVDTVRGVGQGYNATRLLLVNTIGSATNLKMLSQLRVPADDCLAVSMHPYLPWAFCASVDHDSVDYQWTTAVFDGVMEVALDQVLYRAYAQFTSKGVPVVLDEFNAQDKGNTAERLKWMKHYVDTARGYGMTCFLWDSGGTGANSDGNRTAYVERAGTAPSWTNAGQELMARALVAAAAGNDAVAWRSACDTEVPSGVPAGRQLNGEALDFAQKASAAYWANWDDLQAGGIAIEFTGAAPTVYLADRNDRGSASGGWMGIDPSYVEWTAGAAGGVAYWFPDQLKRLWQTGSVDGVPNTTDTLSKFIVGASAGTTATRVVLAGLAPAPDVSGGGYGDGTAAVRRLYTRPYTLGSAGSSEYSVRVDVSNPAIDWSAVTDIAVRYAGDTPQLVFTDDWSQWTACSAYLDVTVPDAEGQRVAFFRASDFRQLVQSATLPMLRVMLSGGTAANPKSCSLAEVVCLGGAPSAAPAMRAASDVRTCDQLLNDLRQGYHLRGHFEAQSNGSGKDGGYSDNEADLNLEATATNRAYVTKKMLADLAEAGFTAVSLPVTWRQHIYETPDNAYQVDRAFLDRVHEVVDWAYDAGLYVVIDVHDDQWLVREGLDSDAERAQAELQAVWSQLAGEFSGYDQRLVFQAMNEPKVGDALVVNELNSAFVRTVRSVPGNQDRLLLAPTYGESTSAENLAAYVLPDDERGLVAASVHEFAPTGFTRFESGKSAEDAEANQGGNAYTPTQREQLDRTFEGIRTGLTNRGIPVVIGEFGSYYYGESRQADRVAWIDAFAAHAKQLGAPAFYSRLDRTSATTGKVVWSAYDEAAQAWSGRASALLSAWSAALSARDLAWGSRARVSAGEHAALSTGEPLVLPAALPASLDQSNTQKSPYSYRATLSPYEGTTQLWKSSETGVIGPALEGKEVAVRFTGDVPYLFPSTSDWKGWPRIEPRTVLGDPAADEGAVAYYPYQTIERIWCDRTYQPTGATQARAMTMDDLSYLSVATAGETTILQAALLSAQPDQGQDAGEDAPGGGGGQATSSVTDVSQVLSRTLGTAPRNVPAATDFHEAFGVEYGYPAYNENFDARVTSAGGDAAAQKAAVLAEDTALLDYTSLDAQGNLYKNGAKKEASADGTTVTKLVRHTAGVSNYGETIPDSAPATTKRLSLRMVRYGNVVTGLYVPPGEVVKITLESSSSDTAPQNLGLKAYIGNFGGNSETVNIPAARTYVRMPHAEKTLALDAADGVNYVGSPFGGALLVYSSGIGGTTVQMTVEGAVEMPTYFYGETSDEELARQLQAPGPYFAFSTPRGLRAVGPASLVRGKTVEQVKRSMDFWDKAIGLSYQFEAGSFDSTNPDTNQMVEMFEPYIPAGAAVNMGNYCICPVSWGSSFLGGDALISAGAWGQIHELNHSFPWGGAIDGMTEISNNAISALTYQLYTNIAANRREPTNRSDPASGGLSGWNWTADLYTTVERLRLNAEAAARSASDPFPRWNLQVYVPLQHAFGADRFLNAVHVYHQKGGKYNQKLSGNELYTNSNVWMRAASEAVGYDLGYYMRDVQGFPELASGDASQTDYITTDVRTGLADIGPVYIPSGCLYASGMVYEASPDAQAGAPAVVSGLGAVDSSAFSAGKELVEMGRAFRIPAGATKTLDFNRSTDGGYVSVANGESVRMVGYTKPEHGTITATDDALKLKYTPDGAHLQDCFYVTLKLTVTDQSSPYVGQTQDVTFKVSLLQQTGGFVTSYYSWTNPSGVARNSAVAYAVNHGALDQEPVSVASSAVAGFDSAPSDTLAVTEGKVYLPKTGAVDLYVRGNYWFNTCVAASADALPAVADAQSKRDWPIGNAGQTYDTTAQTSRIRVYVVPAGASAPADTSGYAAVIAEGDPLYVRAYQLVNGAAGRYRIGYWDGSAVSEFADDQVRALGAGDGLSTPAIGSFTREKLYSYPDPAVQSTTLYGDFVSVGEPLEVSYAWDHTHDRDLTQLANTWSNNGVANIVDDDLGTHFHGKTDGPYRAEFVFKLAQPGTFNIIRYKGHATNSDRGKIKNYHVYVGDSLEAVRAADAPVVAEGTASQANNYGNFNKIELNKYVTGQYVRLVADDEYASNGQYYIAFADFRVGRLDSILGEGAISDAYRTEGAWQADDAFVNTRTQLMSTTSGTGSFTFTGTGVIMYSAKGPAYGTMMVSVDGGEPVEVSLAAATLRGQQPVFWKSGLANGQHTVTFSPKAAGADKVNVEYFEVKTSPSAEPAIEEPEELELSVQLDATRFTYTGSLVQPDMTVMLGDEVVDSGFTATYDDNVNVGAATVTVSLSRDGKDYAASATFEILKAAYAGAPAVRLAGGAEGWRYSKAATSVPAPEVTGAPAESNVAYYYSATYPEGMVESVASSSLSDGSGYGSPWDAAAMNSATLSPDTYYLWAVVSSRNYSSLATRPIAFTVLPAEHVHTWENFAYEWSSDNSSVTATATCVDDASHRLERTVAATYEVTVQPTYESAGTGTYTAEFSAPFSTQVKSVSLPQLTREPVVVTLDANGGFATPDTLHVYEGAAYGELPAATRDGWLFDGWFTAATGGAEVLTTTVVQQSQAHTLYAHWSSTATVSGRVLSGNITSGGMPVEGAHVELRRGNEVLKTFTTGSTGVYEFPLVAYDVYNVVVSATSGGISKTVTTMVDVNDATASDSIVQAGDLALPAYVTDSVLVVDERAPEVVVGELDVLAAAVRSAAELAAGADNVVTAVVVTMNVSVIEAWQAAGGERIAAQAKELAGDDVELTYFDWSLEQAVTTAPSGSLPTGVTETRGITTSANVLTLAIPCDVPEQGSVLVFRHHEGATSALEKVDSRPGDPQDGTYYVDSQAGLVFVYAKEFSTYALGLALESQECNHEWGEWVVTVAPTRTEPGVETRVCQLNSEHVETRAIPPLGDEDEPVVPDVQEEVQERAAELANAGAPQPAAPSTLANTSSASPASAAPATGDALSVAVRVVVAGFGIAVAGVFAALTALLAARRRQG